MAPATTILLIIVFNLMSIGGGNKVLKEVFFVPVKTGTFTLSGFYARPVFTVCFLMVSCNNNEKINFGKDLMTKFSPRYSSENYKLISTNATDIIDPGGWNGQPIRKFEADPTVWPQWRNYH
jgi:hypothetical protein